MSLYFIENHFPFYSASVPSRSNADEGRIINLAHYFVDDYIGSLLIICGTYLI